MSYDFQSPEWTDVTLPGIIILLLFIALGFCILEMITEEYNIHNKNIADFCFQTLSETNAEEFELSDKVRFKLGTSPVNTEFFLKKDCGLDKKKILDILAAHQVINYVFNKKTGKIEYKIVADTFEPKILQELIEPYQSYIQQPGK